VSRERHGIPVSQAPEYGYDFDDPDDLHFFWEMGAYTQPEIVSLSMSMVEEWGCWDQPFFKDIRSLRRPVRRLNRFGLLRPLARYPWMKGHMTLLGEVHKITLKTPDYALSTAQCYRPGTLGNQHHIWQATLSPDAVVFVCHPGTLEDTKGTFYWGGQCRLPKACQVGPVHLSIYRIGRMAAIGEKDLFAFTHAYFPEWAFDEVVEEDEWIFGREGEGYVALTCSRPMERTETGREAGHEIVARGREAVWVCHCGRAVDDGTFEAFRRTVLTSDIRFGQDWVRYDAAGVGEITFSWQGPLTVNGEEVSLDDTPRFDSPYCYAPFGSKVYEIHVDESRLLLDFEALERSAL